MTTALDKGTDIHNMLFNTFSVLSTRWPESIAFLHGMIDFCNQDSEYKARFHDWVLNGSTLKLRELVIPIGDHGSYMEDRDFRNIVNAIDTAHFQAGQILDPTNETGELNPDYTDVHWGKIYNVRGVIPELASNEIYCCIPTRFSGIP